MIWLKFHDGINDRGAMLLAASCSFFERKDGVTVEHEGDGYLIPMLSLARLAEKMINLPTDRVTILEL